MTETDPVGGIEEIRQAVREEQAARQRTGSSEGRPLEAQRPAGWMQQERIRRTVRGIPILGPLARWLYGVLKAPTRIRNLLTLIRLSELEMGRVRSDTEELRSDFHETAATQRREVEALRKEAEALRATLATLQVELEQNRADLAEAREVRFDLRDRLTAAETSLLSREEDIRQLVSKAARLTTSDQERMEALRRVEEAVAGQDARVEGLGERITPLQRQASEASRQLEALQEELAESRGELTQLQDRQEDESRQAQEIQAVYPHLEDRLRGSRLLVRERQSIYLPYLPQAEGAGGDLPVLDLGCGRGEWLELLRGRGIPAQGVDANPTMVERCQAAGLPVVEGDLVRFLASRPDGSAAAVTAFHVLEHLPFAVWMRVLRESIRVLGKGGVAAIETPNPDNPLVGSSGFYLDPTHLRPIPSQLLTLMMETCGFSRCELLELHPVETPAASSDGSQDVFLRRYFQKAQDYAVVGWKA
jgi:O-antigen chain-terminating methyltransferase